jgi:hypothetical protein
MSELNFSFDLPTDPDQKKIAAALLTVAICGLSRSDKSTGDAATAVQFLYDVILDPAPEKIEKAWEKGVR